MNIIAPNNRRPASTIVYLIQCLISLLLTVTLIVSLVQPAQNTSPCPDRQSTLGPRPAGPILARDRGGSDGDQPILQDEPGLTSGTSNERPTQKKWLKTLKMCNRPFVTNIQVPNWLTTCPPWSSKKTDSADHITYYSQPMMLSILFRFIKCLPFFSNQKST